MAVTNANVHTVQLSPSGAIIVHESGGVKTVLSPVTSAADLTTMLSLITSTNTSAAVRNEAHVSLKLHGYSGQNGLYH